MKRVTLLVVLLLLLAGCRLADTAVTPTSNPAATATEPTLASVEATAADAPSPATDISPTETADSPVLPPSPLFDLAWDDRRPFRANLIDSHQNVLNQLPGASVYHLDLQLGENLTTVNGRLALYYTNRSLDTFDFLYFHLYPNLLGGALTVTNVEVNGQAATPTYEDDGGLMQLPLSQALPPQTAVVVTMDFTATVPDTISRNYGVLAYSHDVLALAHAYPIVAVYDDEGWNIDTPAPFGDVLYAETSFYLVRVTAPAGPTIVASGVEIGRGETAVSQTITYAAGPMRDFYLALSNNYTIVSETVGPVQINSYGPAAFGTAIQNALDVAASALAGYSERFGPYPFTEFDIVTTPTEALGIEYPGVIANTVNIYDPDKQLYSAANPIMLESTTAHEVAHQWFYSVVGNDQRDEPWLDEALVQYATWLYFRDRYGDAGASGFYQSLEGRWRRVDEADIPIGLPVSEYEGAEYGAIVYGRGPIFLHQLAETMGEATFDDFLRDYYQTYQWDVAQTADFQNLAEKHCQCELDALFAQWVYP